MSDFEHSEGLDLPDELHRLETETFEIEDIVDVGMDMPKTGGVMSCLMAASSSSCSCSSCCSCSTSSTCSTSTSTSSTS